MKKNISATKKVNPISNKGKSIKMQKNYIFFQYHFLFLFIGLIFGFQFVFVNPPWQTNDEDRHFYNAYALSQGQIVPKIENGRIGYSIPTSLNETVRSFQGIQFDKDTKVSKSKLNSLKHQALNAENTSFCDNPSAGFLPFPYIPAAIMIKIGSLFNNSPIWIGWWGRIGSLFAFLAIIFIAIKNIPHFKPLLFVIALSPMALYQGSSVSYDALSFAFLFLLFSFVIKYYYQKTPITLKQIVIFFLIALAQKFSKDGYFILFFTIFAININKFESKKVYFIGLFLLLIASYLPSYLWNSYISGLNLPAGKFQTDFKFDSVLNIKYHLQNPLNAVAMIIQNIFSQGKLWLSGSIGRFGYSYTLLPDWLILMQFLAFALIVFFEKPTVMLSLKFRIIFLGFAFTNVFALIAVGFLLISPVGANMIFGFQGRYFTPIIPYLFLGLFYIPIFDDREKWLKWIVPVYCILVLLYSISFIESTFYI